MAAVADALDGDELTLDELTEAVVERAGSWAGDLVMPAFQTFWPRWRQAMTAAAWRGAMCFGPPRGRQLTFTSPGRWVDDAAPLAGRGRTGRRGAGVPAQLRTGDVRRTSPAGWVRPKPWARNGFQRLG